MLSRGPLKTLHSTVFPPRGWRTAAGPKPHGSTATVRHATRGPREGEQNLTCPHPCRLAYLPLAAILDHELTLTKPLRLTADTGIDAICHAMEAYVSAKANPFSDGVAASAMRRLGGALHTACSSPADGAARVDLSNAQRRRRGQCREGGRLGEGGVGVPS